MHAVTVALLLALGGCAGQKLPSLAGARVALNTVADATNIIGPIVLAACTAPSPPPNVTVQQCLVAGRSVDALAAGVNALQSSLDGIAEQSQ